MWVSERNMVFVPSGNPDKVVRHRLERIAAKELKEREERFAEDAVSGVLKYLRTQNPSRNYRPVLYSDSEFVMSAGAVGLEKLSSFNIVIVDCGPGLFRKLLPKTIARFSYTGFVVGRPKVKIKTHDKKLLQQEKAAELMPSAKDINYLLWFSRHRDDVDMLV